MSAVQVVSGLQTEKCLKTAYLSCVGFSTWFSNKGEIKLYLSRATPYCWVGLPFIYYFENFI